MIIREKTRKIFAVGVELGGSPQVTAISVVELVPSPSSHTNPPSDPPTLHLRHLERFLPGTLHTEIARWFLDRLDSEMDLQSKEKTPFGELDVDVTVRLVIDQTDAGSGLVDMILEIVKKPARRVIISGLHTQRYSAGITFVPKQELISIVQALLETGRLKFAEDLPSIELLVDALINYQDRKTNPMLAADTLREYPSDDLVLAVALACWELKQDTRFSYEFL